MRVTAASASSQNADIAPKCEPSKDIATMIRATITVGHLKAEEVEEKSPRCANLVRSATLNTVFDIETACANKVDDRVIEREAMRSMVDLSDRIDACLRSETFKQEKQESKSALEILKESLKRIPIDPFLLIN